MSKSVGAAIWDDRAVPYRDTSLLVTDDGEPVDDLYVERQQHLLTNTLHSGWKAPDGNPFRACSNVGLFYEYAEPPLVPDAMLCLDVPPVAGSALEHDNRSFFVWLMGKVPDVVIEIVSEKTRGEDSDKLALYERIGVPYYVI